MNSSFEKALMKLPRGYVPAWSSRAVSIAINTVLLMQITYYATVYVGLDPILVGGLLLASKLFDGFTDLLVGFIIDRTNTKLGKARPYELMLIPLWICNVLLFSTPDIGTTGKAIYIFILYTMIMSVFATFLNGTDAIYLSRSLPNQQQRGKALSLNAVIVMFFSAASSIALPQLMASWGSRPGGWTKISLAFALPLTIIGLGRFFFVKETVVDSVEDKKTLKIGFKESILILGKNKYIFIIATALACSNFATNILSATGAFYFRYVMGNIGLLSIVGMLGLIAPLILLLFPVAMRKIGGMNFIRIGLIFGIFGNMIKFFFPTNLSIVIGGQMMASVGIAPLSMMVNLFLIECMDYGDWKTGKRVDGVVTSVNNFAGKVGSGIASGAVGIIMAIGGYVSTLEVQGQSAINSIVALYSLIPAAICLAMLLLLHFYDLDKKMPQIRQELAARKAGESVELSQLQ